MKFSEYLEANDNNIQFAGFLKDGRIIVYIDGKRYVYVTDTLYHDKWRRMYPYAPWKVLNQIKAKAFDVL